MMKRLFYLILCALLLIPAPGCTGKLNPPVLTKCLNIGNCLDAPKGQSWGVPMDISYFSTIKQAGFEAVRLPVRFSDYVGSKSDDYRLDETFMKSIDSYVDAALNQHLTLILDLHHFLQIMNDPKENEACLIAIWKQLAERYKDRSNSLVFEILNEPQGNLDSDTWNSILADTVKAIRAIDKTHYLIVGGANYNSIDALGALNLPDDDRLIATVHYYEPNDVTFQGDPNNVVAGKDYSVITNVRWTGTTQEMSYLETRLKTAKSWADAHNVPLFLGEFGVNIKAPAATRVKWTSAVASEADKFGISYSYWEFASDFVIYNLSTGKWNTDMLHALLGPSK